MLPLFTRFQPQICRGENTGLDCCRTAADLARFDSYQSNSSMQVDLNTLLEGKREKLFCGGKPCLYAGKALHSSFGTPQYIYEKTFNLRMWTSATIAQKSLWGWVNGMLVGQGANQLHVWITRRHWTRQYLWWWDFSLPIFIFFTTHFREFAMPGGVKVCCCFCVLFSDLVAVASKVHLQMHIFQASFPFGIG